MPDFEQALQQKGLMASTRQKYEEIIQGSKGDTASDLLHWLRSLMSKGAPLGTVLPARAAVKHFLVSQHGYSLDALEGLLPQANGKPANMHLPLAPHQLAVFHLALESVSSPSIKTLLALLPQTGLRIGEACRLKVSDYIKDEGMLLVGQNKRPLSSAAQKTLNAYISAHEPTTWLFSGYSGQPIGAHGVRKYTRKMALEFPELIGLCPQVLRTTAAVIWLKSGVDQRVVQRALGHKNLLTTQRYLGLI